MAGSLKLATIVSSPRSNAPQGLGEEGLVGLDVGRGPLDVEVDDHARQRLEHRVERGDPEPGVARRARPRSGYAASSRPGDTSAPGAHQ